MNIDAIFSLELGVLGGRERKKWWRACIFVYLIRHKVENETGEETFLINNNPRKLIKNSVGMNVCLDCLRKRREREGA